MASWGTYLQVFLHVALLFFFIPIKIEGPDEIEEQFIVYLKQFNKTYASDDYQKRLLAFKQSSLNIVNLNNDRISNDSAHYGWTKYSDMLPEEFILNHLQANLSQKLTNKRRFREKRSSDNFTQKIDWRERKMVTSMKNQEGCGACYAFSVIETMESMHAIKRKQLVELSVQQIIDCAGYNNDGCNGGDTCSLLYWMKNSNISVETEVQYPLILAKEACHQNSGQAGVQIDDFTCENFVGAEDVILDLLAKNGPLVVAINAQTWQNYIGGVIHFHCDGALTSLNHAVQIVGYDLTAKIPHYIVRNTWGPDFGDGGYLYIAIGQNMCGLANEVSALTVL